MKVAVSRILPTYFLAILLLISASISHVLGGGTFNLTIGFFLLPPMALVSAAFAVYSRSQTFVDLEFLASLIVFQFLTHMSLQYQSGVSDTRMVLSHFAAISTSYLIGSKIEGLILGFIALTKKYLVLNISFKIPAFPEPVRFKFSNWVSPVITSFVPFRFSGLAPPQFSAL